MPANTGYRLALRTPGAARFFGAACPARLGIAMTGLGIVWLVHWRTNSYGSAGIVTGGFAVSEAVIGPQVARLIDRFGQTRVLPRCLLAHGVAVALLLTAVVNNRPLWLIVAAGILAGSSIPQIGALSAARWSALLDGSPALPAAFALESLANELAFLVGPVLVATVCVFVHPAAGSALAALLIIGAGLVFARQRSTAPVPAGLTNRLRGSVFRQRGFGVLLIANISLGLFFGAMQVSVTAFAVAHGVAAAAGPLYAVSGIASICAGFGYGLRRWRISPPARLTVAFAALTVGCVPLVLATGIPLLIVGLAMSGAAIAPILILGGTLVQRLVDGAVRTQAFSWINSASAAGIAAAAAIAGRVVDGTDPRWGFAIALTAGAFATSAVFLARGRLREHHIDQPRRPDDHPRRPVAVEQPNHGG